MRPTDMNEIQKQNFIELPEIIEIVAMPDMVKKGQDLVYSRSLDAQTRTAFAQQINIPDIEKLDLEISLIPFQDGINIEIVYDAFLTRQCIVSLENFSHPLKDKQIVTLMLTRAYETYITRLEEDENFAQTQMDENEPEKLDETGVPLVSLALEILSLNLDPYPKKPGIKESEHQSLTQKTDDDALHKPFANLGELLKNKNNG